MVNKQDRKMIVEVVRYVAVVCLVALGASDLVGVI